MRFGVVVFPGSNCDRDCYHVLNNVIEQHVEYIWHTDTNIKRFDCIVLPGGFSYGDYLRCGAVAKCSSVIEAIREHVEEDKLVIGICNGFQVLTETGLLPGALIMNKIPKFICKPVELVITNANTPFTTEYQVGDIARIPIAHMEGCYYIDREKLKKLKDRGQIVFQYMDNPNGSVENIAGITNKKGNVLGMMPHPERASESILDSTDGKKIFISIVKSFSL